MKFPFLDVGFAVICCLVVLFLCLFRFGFDNWVLSSDLGDFYCLRVGCV